MGLELLCGQTKSFEELITACIKEHLSLAGDVDSYGIAIVIKTLGDIESMCGKEMTLKEYIASAVSIVECPAGNVIALNVVVETCECLDCGQEMNCNTNELPLDIKIARCFVPTSDGEYALRLYNVTT